MHILLEPGDIIREGDEWYDSGFACWFRISLKESLLCVFSVGAIYTEGSDPVRRSLTPWEVVKHALESIPDTDATTTEAYWDCECETNHIRYCGHPYCARCGAHRQDQPDSRLREVLLSLLPK